MTTNLNTTLSTYGASHATLASYTAGFFFSIILTLIPYEIVREHIMEGTELLYTITLFALLQFIVQIVFFLHLSGRSKAKWNLLAMAFTVLTVIFLVVGTVWIMRNLSQNAMSSLHLNNMMNLSHGD